MTAQPIHGSGGLNRDQVWQAVDGQRQRVADLLDSLSDGEWDQPSLCQGWTVRDVAAHLTMQQLGARDVIAMMGQWRGSLDRTTHHVACRRAAALPTRQLIAEIRGTVGSRRHNIGVTRLETLIDILVHGQDIAIPLGRQLAMPLDAAATAATRVWTMRWPPPFPARRKMAGFRLVASDIPWSAGEGTEVQAPIDAILLLSCGRLAVLPQLSGPGAADLTARLSTP